MWDWIIKLCGDAKIYEANNPCGVIMQMNLLDLLLLSPWVYEEWGKLSRAAALAAMQSGVWAGSGEDEDARIEFDGTLVIFAQLGHEKPELRVPKGAWSVTYFEQLPPETSTWVTGLIAERTPRDRMSRGTCWQGKLFGHIDAKGYVSPDGKVFRFVYNGQGPYQCLNDSAAFGYSLGDAVPEWAKGK